MVRRRLLAVLRSRLRDSPAVALVGPRQSGKTTLARSLGGQYFDLEQESDRLKLDLRWQEVLRSRALVVLDEAQTWPDLFLRLRGAIDADRPRRGRFLLLGSVSPSLMVRVSESLAGRLALVELTPFLASEVPANRMRRLWLSGGYPDGGILGRGQFPRWQEDYLTLLAQRDLPAWGLPARPQVTLRLLRMLAACHGQVWNASRIGQALGLSYHTVQTYTDWLVGAFLIRLLPPYEANLTKRLVRSPKVYWRDSGLLHALLRVEDEDELLDQPWVGASWEGFVIEQVLGVLAQRDQPVRASFLRTSDPHEIDLILELGRRVWAIEIKLTSSPSPSDADRLNRVADLIGAERRALISQTPVRTASDRFVSCDLAGFLRTLAGRP